MEIVYPPVGIAHIIGQIPDLITDRMATASRVRVACAMQPKAAPHFGTGIVILTAFALARLFQDTFGKPASVLLDMLDNAPRRPSSSATSSTACACHTPPTAAAAPRTPTPNRSGGSPPGPPRRPGPASRAAATARFRPSRDSGAGWRTSCPVRKCSRRCSARPGVSSASARCARSAAWSTKQRAPSRSGTPTDSLSRSGAVTTATR